jgi:amino acid permease
MALRPGVSSPLLHMSANTFGVQLTGLISTGTLALLNGGPAGAVWVFLAVACGMFTVVLSMAEMASM